MEQRPEHSSTEPRTGYGCRTCCKIAIALIDAASGERLVNDS